LSAVNAIDPVSAPAAPDHRLLSLQALDLAVDRLRARHQALEGAEEFRQASARVRDLEAQIGELKLTIADVARDQTRLETDIDSMGQKAEAERKRLYDGSVANAKELQSIEAEVAGLRTRISSKEDQLLELMERREELEGGLAPVESELAEARSRLDEIDSSAGRELDEIEQSLRAKAPEREQLVAAIDPDLLELYEELRKQKKGVAAVELVDGVCQGCHQKMSPVYLERLKKNAGIRRCEYCRRIVVPT
jgi:predicted  nucleic acid-binding Zn-ribbon protein